MARPERGHPFDRRSLARELARTYGGDRDPWERVVEYQRVIDYAARHTNKGSAAIANALDLPRGRIRPWLDGDARPDPVQGVETAERHGWLGLNYETMPFTGINVLVAWIYSGGSIGADWFVPLFALRRDDAFDDRTRLDRAFERIGIDYELQHSDASNRATEARPADDASVLGRLLATLGAPVGAKERAKGIELPTYLDDAPEDVARAFVDTYVRNRGTLRRDRPAAWVACREARAPTYRRTLAALFRRVLGDGITVSEANVYLSRDAAATLDIE